MIRIFKSSIIPPSLIADNCIKYNEQDVQSALVTDQHQKCYLCEQNTTKNFQIEHLKAKAIYPQFEYTWTNLFLSCAYCNGRKPNNFDLIDPSSINVEDIIVQRLDLAARTAEITALTAGDKEDFTVTLLDKIFNGKTGLRDIKGEILFKDLEREIVFFLKLLLEYEIAKTPENKQKIVDSILITKDFLAFKYWIIKDNPNLYNEFKDYLVWNKIT